MEEWKTTTINDDYEVSNIGRVRRISSGLILKLQKHNAGYMRVKISGEKRLIHRLVCCAFLGDSKLHVNHKNGIKIDNRLENLEFVTTLENSRHAIETGLVQVEKVRSMDMDGNIGTYVAIYDAAEKTGVSKCMVKSVLHGEAKSSGGFIFFKGSLRPSYDFSDIDRRTSKPKPVYVKYRTGVSDSFASIGEASRMTGKDSDSIRDWCNGKVRCKTAMWSFN